MHISLLIQTLIFQFEDNVLIDLFLTNLQLFSSLDVNRWTGGLEYLCIIEMFYQLFVLSF